MSVIKLLFSGKSGVGKTYISSIIQNKKYINKPTIGVDFSTTYIKEKSRDSCSMMNKYKKVYLWEISGDDRFMWLNENFIKRLSMDVLVLFYNPFDKDSLNYIKNVNTIDKDVNKENNSPKVVVAVDFDSSKNMYLEEGKKFARDENITHIHIKPNNNIVVENENEKKQLHISKIVDEIVKNVNTKQNFLLDDDSKKQQCVIL